MMHPIDADFIPAEDSIRWAEEAISELCSSIDAFFGGDVIRSVTEFDSDTAEKVFKVKLLQNLPHGLRRKATEALNNARHSFDQSIFAARNILGRRSNKGVNYPWSRDPVDLTRLLQERRIDTRLWDTIRAHEPYPASDSQPRGDDLIRTLATIANGKHKVGLAVDIQIPSIRYPTIHGIRVERMQVLTPRWNAAKNEAELIRWKGEVEIADNYEFDVRVCLKDSRLSEPTDAVGALRLFTAKAKEVCETVKLKCFELTN